MARGVQTYMRPLRIGFFVLLATLALGQEETLVPANDVSFTATTEASSYKAGEQVIVRYEIRNISNGSVYVPREWDSKCPASPHIWAWFENSSGQHFVPGYAGDCSPSHQTVMERMKRDAVLLKPGQRLEGHLSLQTTLFGGMKPGAYRIEAVLYGWSDKDFDEHELKELQTMHGRFMRGEVPASTRIKLTR
jgi:hypothetical protein